MRALVTGSAGFVGSHLTEALLARGDSVVGIDCFNDNYGRSQKLANLRSVTDWDNFEFVPVDLARGDLAELTAEADVVFHLAAEPGVRSGWGPRYGHFVRNNILATQHLLDALKDRDDVRLVFASSSSVYGDASQRPTPEDALREPLSPYGQTKVAAEQLCHLYAANYGLDYVCLRYFTVFGPRQRPDMAFHVFGRAALAGRPVTVFGDGHQTRDFTYVGDVVEATLSAATAPLGDRRTFNIGGGAPASIRDVLALLRTMVAGELQVSFLPAELGDVRDTAANVRQARDVLRYRPRTSLEEGLLAQMDWMLEEDVAISG